MKFSDLFIKLKIALNRSQNYMAIIQFGANITVFTVITGINPWWMALLLPAFVVFMVHDQKNFHGQELDILYMRSKTFQEILERLRRIDQGSSRNNPRPGRPGWRYNRKYRPGRVYQVRGL